MTDGGLVVRQTTRKWKSWEERETNMTIAKAVV
jgi:hypothetical protein